MIKSDSGYFKQKYLPGHSNIWWNRRGCQKLGQESNHGDSGPRIAESFESSTWNPAINLTQLYDFLSLSLDI